MDQNYLFMILLGCKPPGRKTEQHDVFFSIAKELKDCKEDILLSWPEDRDGLHIDAYRPIKNVGAYTIGIHKRETGQAIGDKEQEGLHLYFVNLGGYQKGALEEFHYKTLVVARNSAEAARQAKEAPFASTHLSVHVDDQYALDVDDIYEVSDILPNRIKKEFVLTILPGSQSETDPIVNGYLPLHKL